MLYRYCADADTWLANRGGGPATSSDMLVPAKSSLFLVSSNEDLSSSTSPAATAPCAYFATSGHATLTPRVER